MAHASLFVYHPVTRRSRLGWELARFLARRGVFGPRRGLPLLPREVWEMFWAYLRRSSTRMKPGVPRRALRVRHELARMLES